jgi:hypothetical protein
MRKSKVGALAPVLLGLSLGLGHVTGASAKDWDNRNRLAASTWRFVDQLYVDRTFNNLDWFKLRQGMRKCE